MQPYSLFEKQNKLQSVTLTHDNNQSNAVSISQLNEALQNNAFSVTCNVNSTPPMSSISTSLSSPDHPIQCHNNVNISELRKSID